MSTSTISTLVFISQEVTIFLGIPILIIGVIGGMINIIVFLSLKTFRQSSCAFYLTIMSIVNIGQLVTGLFSRIMISGFDIDWTLSSIFYCKFRAYLYQICLLTSLTCMCLATIDQFLATCYNPRWQQWSNIKMAHRLIIGFVIIWLLHGIPYWFHYNHRESSTMGKLACASTNEIFRKYHIGVFLVILAGILPIFITTLFGLLAYRNINNLAYRTVPLVRRESDKQLTVIVLIQIVYNLLGITPYIIVNIIILNTIMTQNSIISETLNFANIITICLHYLNFASPFYMYMCVSRRFRQQFIHVFYKIYINQWRKRRAAAIDPAL